MMMISCRALNDKSTVVVNCFINRWMNTSVKREIPKTRRNRNVSQNFVDYRKVRIEAGRGGNGMSHFGREAFKAVAPADGGNGGRGSDIWVVVEPAGKDLRSIKSAYNGDHGGRGRAAYARGHNGKDMIITVPKGTVLSEYIPKVLPRTWPCDGRLPHDSLYIDTSHPLMPVGTRFMIARGGGGGKGNSHFVTSTNRSPDDFTEGSPGQIRFLEFQLKCIADIGLVGLPNAGKSSFIRAVSRCKTQVGSWAFTTLYPHIATVKFESQEERVSSFIDVEQILSQSNTDVTFFSQRQSTNKIRPPFSFTLADIPGIIKGACLENKGLGHEFLRHIERSKLLVYVVDLSRDRPWEDLSILISELEAYKEGMSNQKKGLILANKCDLDGAMNNYEELTRIFEDWTVIPISSLYHENLSEALWRMRDILEEEKRKEDGEFEKNLNEQLEKYGEIVEFDWMKQVRGALKVEIPNQ